MTGKDTAMNTQVYEVASEWLVEFRTDEADPRTRARFEQWLNASPLHVHAYLELAALWEDFSGVDEGKHVDVEALIAAARNESNVLPLNVDGRQDDGILVERGHAAPADARLVMAPETAVDAH